jgi:glutamine cyclotransferase
LIILTFILSSKIKVFFINELEWINEKIHTLMFGKKDAIAVNPINGAVEGIPRATSGLRKTN